jgi:hypothetical protein
MVPEPQYPEALVGEPTVAIHIRLSLRVKVMLPPIDLND